MVLDLLITISFFLIIRKTNTKHAIMTYDDPSTYKGPIVQGWPPTKNRSVRLYIKRKCVSC